MRRLFLSLLFLGFASLQARPELLKKTDVRTTMEELFSYHVEYKELTPTLLKRSFKAYIEQFDAQKLYLLQKEVKPYLELTSSDIETILDQYYTDEFSAYDYLDQKIVRAIERARSLRQELYKELIAAEMLPDISSQGDYFYQFAKTEDEIKSRFRYELVLILKAEQKMARPDAWNAERREKILSLVEKRFCRFESGRMPQASLQEHNQTMHILKAMARTLDAHTGYFTPQEAFEMRTSLEKQFEGVGVVLRESVDGVQVVDLVKGGPAEKSGKVEVGDVILEINGKSVAAASYDEVLEELKGRGEKSVSLVLKRAAADSLRVDLTREKIVMEDDRVTFQTEPFGDGVIGKIVLPSFYESADSSSCEMDIRNALKEMRKKGKLVGLVLDMRENLGGFLSQAVKVSGLFMTSGVVVISKYAQGEIQYLRNVDPRLYYNGPLVILTSKMSASAAEIVAQALQDYGVGIVVGDERTYGKGTIQYQTVTDPAASAFFKVTVGRYYTVSGRSTQIEGVKADIVVPTAFAPYNIGEKYLEFPLHNDQVTSAYHDSLGDLDPHAKAWFQKNYIPYIQKKESVWVKMLPQLSQNSSYRLKNDPNFKAFLERSKTSGSPFDKGLSWGVDDLQMGEAVRIVKDMIALEPVAKK